MQEEERVRVAAERIKISYRGVQLSVTGLPTRRVVSDTQKRAVAELFGAEVRSVSMSTLLWNAEDGHVKAFRSAVSSIHRLYLDRAYTLPTVRPGLRLIKKDAIAEFNKQVLEGERALRVAATNLRNNMAGIIERERKRRGNLFNESDYNFDPVAYCKVDWSFPSVVADLELAEIDPSVYAQEILRTRQELQAVVKQCEQQMAEEMYEMLDSLVERLEDGPGGEKKRFKDSTVTKIYDELQYMSSQLANNGIGGQVIRDVCQRVSTTLVGFTADQMPEQLRDFDDYRNRIRERTQHIAEHLLNDQVLAPRRLLLTRRAAERRAEKSKGAK